MRRMTAMPTQSATAIADAEPHLADCVAAALLDQEGGDDADDQRGLDALAQGDDKSGDHRCWFLCSTWSDIS